MREIYYRWIEASLTGRESKNKIKLLFGARQTGKSTLLKKFAGEDAVIINLQDRSERLLYERNTGELVKRLRAEKKSRVLIDEIQKVPGLLEDIQLIYDENPDKFDFWISGSSARKLFKASANLLPGRAHNFKIFPVMYPEIENNADSSILPMEGYKENKKFPAVSIENCLLYGSLPGIMLEEEKSRGKTLEAYAEVYLEEEIRKEALIKNVGHFLSFLELSAVESGQIMNLTGLSKQSGIPVSTIKTYYQALVDTYIGYWIPPFIKHPRKRLLKTPKFYYFDTGVRNALAQAPFDRRLLGVQAGPLFEQWAVSELYHRCASLGKGHKIYFWKTVSGAEVDVILETPDKIIPIEIKWTQTPDKNDTRSLETFLDLYAKYADRGFVICRTPHRQQLSRRITAIPWQEI